MAKSKHKLQTPKPGANTYLQKKEMEKQVRLRRQDILTQMCLDAACISVNETFNRKGEIVKVFCQNMMDAFNEIARMTVEDARDDPEFEYAKTKLDERLKYIMGDNFQPWEQRYNQD